jgi:1-deoxy-D-xylulose-5-phosphate reductoisomerase
VKGIVILGSTGSIGQQTLAIIRAFPQCFTVVGLAAGNNLNLLMQQVNEFRPRFFSCLSYPEHSNTVFPDGCFPMPMEEMVAHTDTDMVVVATMGMTGLRPTLEALRHGKSVALANKEIIVMAGQLAMLEAKQHGATILPVDSEPSAIWQCLQGEDSEASRVIITASGGAFRNRSPEELANVTPEEALKHPTWHMGKKITVDSATLMNKAFEVIESHWLFDMPWEKIDVVIHPQSIIHSMVEFCDGSVKAQMGPPDMRLPIQYALFHPKRVSNPSLPRFDAIRNPSLTFEPLEPKLYPCFDIALEAGKAGGSYPISLNAADEVAVGLFLQERIGFLDIYRVVSQTLDAAQPTCDGSPESILETDKWARARAREIAAA